MDVPVAYGAGVGHGEGGINRPKFKVVAQAIADDYSGEMEALTRVNTEIIEIPATPAVTI